MQRASLIVVGILAAACESGQRPSPAQPQPQAQAGLSGPTVTSWSAAADGRRIGVIQEPIVCYVAASGSGQCYFSLQTCEEFLAQTRAINTSERFLADLASAQCAPAAETSCARGRWTGTGQIKAHCTPTVDQCEQERVMFGSAGPDLEILDSSCSTYRSR